MVDCHTHCKHSHDSFVKPKIVIEEAIKKGMSYLAFTDHNDRDYLTIGGMKQLNIPKHINEILKLKDEFAGKINIALGMECAYSKDAEEQYIKDLSLTDKWDIILNSVHTVDGLDTYFPAYFENKDKITAYSQYLVKVLESLNVKYSYDVVGHIGYVTRKSPFENTYMYYNDHKDLLDEILKTIINKNVSLELNTHCKGCQSNFIPHIEIIQRYLDLGGEDFTFGSDAHLPIRLCDNFDIVTDMLKSLNVKYLNIYMARQKIKVKI